MQSLQRLSLSLILYLAMVFSSYFQLLAQSIKRVQRVAGRICLVYLAPVR